MCTGHISDDANNAFLLWWLPAESAAQRCGFFAWPRPDFKALHRKGYLPVGVPPCNRQAWFPTTRMMNATSCFIASCRESCLPSNGPRNCVSPALAFCFSRGIRAAISGNAGQPAVVSAWHLKRGDFRGKRSRLSARAEFAQSLIWASVRRVTTQTQNRESVLGHECWPSALRCQSWQCKLSADALLCAALITLLFADVVCNQLTSAPSGGRGVGVGVIL